MSHNLAAQPWRTGFLLALCLSTGYAAARESAESQTTDPWAPFRLLEGNWEGAIEGRLGQGKGRRRFKFVLDEKFVLLEHASIRLPQDKSPGGDYHREIGVFSFDRDRDKVIYREFLVEGYVNQYVCEVEPKQFVCTTESVENGAGMKARLTLEILDAYRFDETFELAGRGEELGLYFTNRWTRVPSFDD